MNEYEYEHGYPPAAPGDHDRVVSSGAWAGTIAAALGMCWVSAKLPYLLAWTVNSSVTIGVSYAMARWKRAWYAWLSFWLIVAVSLANGLLKAATPWLDSPWSGASWVLALVIVWSWYWMVRIPRLQPAAAAVERREVHVFHHVIHHGQELPGWSAAEVTSDTAARKVITGAARAVEPARKAGYLLGVSASRVRAAITDGK